MKSGLKGAAADRAAGELERSNLCRDEKGTERILHLLLQVKYYRSNLCPDEKGTESYLE